MNMESSEYEFTPPTRRWWGLDGAVNSSRDFSSGIVQLLVGPRQEARYAHKNILTKIPFFESMLMENRWGEGSSKFTPIKLPEDDPAVFDHILAYAYQGNVALRALSTTTLVEDALEKANPGKGTAEEAKQAEQIQARRSQEMMSLVNLYIMADKFNMEQCLNDIVDQYQDYLMYQGVDCASFVQLVNYGPQECELRDMITTQIAYESSQEGYEIYKQKKPELFSAFVEASVENALQFAKAVCDSWEANPAAQSIGKWRRNKQTQNYTLPVVQDDLVAYDGNLA